jgi:hypothetical protein
MKEMRLKERRKLASKRKSDKRKLRRQLKISKSRTRYWL